MIYGMVDFLFLMTWMIDLRKLLALFGSIDRMFYASKKQVDSKSKRSIYILLIYLVFLTSHSSKQTKRMMGSETT